MPTPMPRTGHAAFGDQAHQHAVERFAAGIVQPDGRVEHPAVATGVEVGAADEHDAVEPIEQLLEVASSSYGGMRTGRPPAWTMASK